MPVMHLEVPQLRMMSEDEKGEALATQLSSPSKKSLVSALREFVSFSLVVLSVEVSAM